MDTEAEAIQLETLRILPKGVPLPSHRHATPSGPWPWMDLESPETNHPLLVKPCGHEHCGICIRWLKYPQSHFPNWTPDQVTRCQIASAISDRQHDCTVYHVDVADDQGKFQLASEKGNLVTKKNQREFWKWLQRDVSGRFGQWLGRSEDILGQCQSRPPGLRIRALIVEELSGPVLQILGARWVVFALKYSAS
jgi:hypothetical protein